MQLFCQSQNYVSLDTLEFILKEHEDLNVVICAFEKEYRLKLYTKGLKFFLGTTRRLLRIPSKAKYPNLWRFLAHEPETWCRLLHIEIVYSKK